MNLARLMPAQWSAPRQKRISPLALNWHVPAMGLRFKLVVLVITVSLIGAFTSTFLILTLQRQQLLESMQASLTRSSIAIGASLEHAMVRNDRAMTTRIVQRMVKPESIEHVRILDVSGLVRISSTESEVGERFRSTDVICQSCHASKDRSPSHTRVAQSSDGRPILLNITHIENSPQCHGCHGTSAAVLGILMVESPLTDLHNQLTAAFWRISLASALTMGLLVALLLVALQRLVIRPVNQLIAGMTEVRAGHLDLNVQTSSQDELGDLAEAFDTMRLQLKSSLQQARHMATLQERYRLAREMHDDLAQKLAYIKTRLWLTNDFLARGQDTLARANVTELSQVTDEAYMDIRETIYSLRAAVPSKEGLALGLREYLADFQSQYGIEARLICPDPTWSEFPADVEAQLSRIIQEALANIRKHARAHTAWVRFQRADGEVRISIEDDGTGFEVGDRGASRLKHFGLGIMIERAETIGGRLEIDSKRRGGTRIILHLPIHAASKDE